MLEPLFAKLGTVMKLSDADRKALEGLSTHVRRVEALRDITAEGDRPEHVHLVLEGWAARYKVTPTGARQITAFLIPGDFCDLHITVLAEMDHSIAALTSATVAQLVPDRIAELSHTHPHLVTGLWWATLVDEAVLRSWIVNLGRRSALQRLAHLICELHLRMAHVGLAEHDVFRLPLTQEQLADALGLTPVHTNRTLQALRARELLAWHGRDMEILDIARLRQVAGFDANYLHTAPLREARLGPVPR